jgi:hypothetical protein
MDADEQARQRLLIELENVELDMSEETLESVAKRMSNMFPSVDDAIEFVEENASYLYYLMEDSYEGD